DYDRARRDDAGNEIVVVPPVARASGDRGLVIPRPTVHRVGLRRGRLGERLERGVFEDDGAAVAGAGRAAVDEHRGASEGEVPRRGGRVRERDDAVFAEAVEREVSAFTARIEVADERGGERRGRGRHHRRAPGDGEGEQEREDPEHRRDEGWMGRWDEVGMRGGGRRGPPPAGPQAPSIAYSLRSFQLIRGKKSSTTGIVRM